MPIPYLKILLSQLIVLLVSVHCSYGGHGVSLDGSLKYSEGFKQFAYTSADFKRGGRLVLHDIGSFDKLNPFTLKGTPAYGVDSLVFEQLAVASLDEPFSQYGLIAEDIEVAADNKSVTFTLNPRAAFSDGSPVTVEDVGYSLDLMKGDNVHPQYNYYYQDILGWVKVGERKIRFNFGRPNRELHMIASQLNILPKKYHQENGFAENSNGGGLSLPVGSGPYKVVKVQPGKTITYQRNDNYWAQNHPTRKGIFNFDEIVVKSFKDQIIALEAFKAGEFDFLSVNIAKQWARDMGGKRFTEGTLLKKTFPHKNNAGIQGFALNTRRELFKDRLVRKALGLALDFEWINASLFHNQYTRNNSFFSNSYLSAKGLPDTLELEYLEPFRDRLPEEVFTSPLMAPSAVGVGGLRKNLLEARDLLTEAGWTFQDGELRDSNGKPFVFEILLVQSSFERVMANYVKNLNKIGIRASYRTIDLALYIERLKKFDFDMIVTSYGQSQSPGNEQRNYWQSSAAKTNGSQNYAGIESEVVDALVDRIIYAKTKKELIASCNALDRVLWYGYYVIPNWYLPVHRLSYRDRFSIPNVLPIYYDSFQFLMTWSVGK